MRKILHLSDLHFGRINPETIQPLLAAISNIKPDILVVSGDLTQRAKKEEFMAAKEFLSRFRIPQVVVPGNHDVPLWNPWKRFVKPLDGYLAYIGEAEPAYVDQEIAVFGINSARSLTFKEGRVSLWQILRIEKMMDALPPETVRIVVAHHPFDLPQDHPGDIIGRAHLFMRMLAKHKIDLLLSGHLHVNHVGHSADRYQVSDHSSLIIHAGTAISARKRGEPNSFNVITIAAPQLILETYIRHAKEFVPTRTDKFIETEKGWTKEAA